MSSNKFAQDSEQSATRCVRDIILCNVLIFRISWPASFVRRGFSRFSVDFYASSTEPLLDGEDITRFQEHAALRCYI